MSQPRVCPSCGVECARLHEGYCEECHNERQAALDLHNAEYDYWQRMTPTQREAQIKWAMR